MLHHHRRFVSWTVFKRILTLFILTIAFFGLVVPSTVVVAVPSAPVIYRGTQWYGGSGVNICINTNGGGSKEYCGNEKRIGGVPGAWWQCVEFVQRFYKKMGWHSGVFSGVWYAHDIFDVAAKNGFTRQANGHITNIEPGDMIVHHKNAPYTGGAGHVSIVDHISGSIVYAVEQNTGSPTAAYTLSGKTLNRQSLNMIRGIVKPKSDGTPNPTTSAATALTYATARDNTPRVFSGAKNGKLYQTTWKWGNGNRPTTTQLSSSAAAVTAIASQSTKNAHPQVVYGTQSGDIYRIQWSASNQPVTTKVAATGSSILSLAITNGTNGRLFAYSGTQNGNVYATQWTGSSAGSTVTAARLGSAVNTVSFGIDRQQPRLYAGTQNGQLHELQWAWNTLSYNTRVLTTLPSAVTSTAYVPSNTAPRLYAGTQDGTIHQTYWGDTALGTTQLNKFASPVTAITYGTNSTGNPRLYTATPNGRLYQTYWGDSPRGTEYFDAVNGTVSQMIYTTTNTGQPRIYSASDNGAIYQTHWGDAKLGVLELAHP